MLRASDIVHSIKVTVGRRPWSNDPRFEAWFKRLHVHVVDKGIIVTSHYTRSVYYEGPAVDVETLKEIIWPKFTEVHGTMEDIRQRPGL